MEHHPEQREDHLSVSAREGVTTLYLSLNEIQQMVPIDQTDTILRCTATIRANISIKHPNHERRTETGNQILEINPGYIVELDVPVLSQPLDQALPFEDGEAQMVFGLGYSSDHELSVTFADAIRALGIDPDAKIWTMRAEL